MRGLPVSMSSSLASSRPSRTCDPGSSSRGRPVLSASARIALSAARIRTNTRRASAAAFSSAPPAMLWMTFSPPASRHPTSSCRFMSWFPSKINTQSQSPSSVSPMGQNSGCCCGSGSGSGSGSAEADAARGFAVAVNVGCCGARVRMMTWPSATEPSPAAVNSSSGSSAMPTSDGRAAAAPSGARPSTSNDIPCPLPRALPAAPLASVRGAGRGRAAAPRPTRGLSAASAASALRRRHRGPAAANALASWRAGV